MQFSLVNDKEFSDIVAPLCNLQTGPWVAGGSVRKVWQGLPWQNQDIDFFCTGQIQFRVLSEILSRKYNIDDVYKTDKAHTYTIKKNSNNLSNVSVWDLSKITTADEDNVNFEYDYKLQVICKNWYDSALHIVNDFDFHVSQFVTDGFTIMATDQAIENIKNNFITINENHKQPIKPLRILKYCAYGFDIDFKEYKKSIQSICNNGVDVNEY